MLQMTDRQMTERLNLQSAKNCEYLPGQSFGVLSIGRGSNHLQFNLFTLVGVHVLLNVRMTEILKTQRVNRDHAITPQVGQV